MYEEDEELWGRTFLCSCSLGTSSVRCQSCESTANPMLLPSCRNFCPIAEVTPGLEKASTSNMWLCISIEVKKISLECCLHISKLMLFTIAFSHPLVSDTLNFMIRLKRAFQKQCVPYLLHLKSRCSQANMNVLSKSMLWNANEFAMSA